MRGHRYASVSLGQGQEPIAEQRLADFHKRGGWLLLQNIHLTIDWTTTVLDARIDKLSEGAHPDFRYAYSTPSHPALPILDITVAVGRSGGHAPLVAAIWQPAPCLVWLPCRGTAMVAGSNHPAGPGTCRHGRTWCTSLSTRGFKQILALPCACVTCARLQAVPVSRGAPPAGAAPAHLPPAELHQAHQRAP